MTTLPRDRCVVKIQLYFTFIEFRNCQSISSAGLVFSDLGQAKCVMAAFNSK